MKNVLLFTQLFGFMILTQGLLAQDFNKLQSSYDHFETVNSYWKDHVSDAPQGLYSYNSEIDRIQAHLKNVCSSLYKHAPEGVSAEQLQNRRLLIDALDKYADRKIFPENRYHSVRTPYFVDDDNVHCAVGYLMAYSGSGELVARIRKEHNYDYIKDIKTDGVAQWAQGNGFSIEELKWIQPTYAPGNYLSAVGQGTNGTVKKFTVDNAQSRLIFAGDFTQLEGLSCVNVGVFKDEQLSCLGAGISGTVNDLLYDNNLDRVYVAGSFTNNSQDYPIAFYNGLTWQYLEVPGRPNATATALNRYNYPSYDLEVIIEDPNQVDNYELWKYSPSGVWILEAEFDGIVLEIERTNLWGSHAYAGHFSTITHYHPSGDTLYFNTNNATFHDTFNDTWISVGPEISDTVKTIMSQGALGAAVYFGGNCSPENGQSNICLTRYLNNTTQPIVYWEAFVNIDSIPASINAMWFNPWKSTITFGGDFEFNAFVMGTDSYYLADLNILSNQIGALAYLDQPVHDIEYWENQVYISGEFTNNLMSIPMNHLARFSPTADIASIDSEMEITVSPVPFLDHVKIDGIDNINSFILLNSLGQIVKQGKLSSNEINDLDDLPQGAYILKLKSDQGEFTERIIK